MPGSAITSKTFARPLNCQSDVVRMGRQHFRKGMLWSSSQVT
jgi:hypothetical protein